MYSSRYMNAACVVIAVIVTVAVMIIMLVSCIRFSPPLRNDCGLVLSWSIPTNIRLQRSLQSLVYRMHYLDIRSAAASALLECIS